VQARSSSECAQQRLAHLTRAGNSRTPEKGRSCTAAVGDRVFAGQQLCMLSEQGSDLEEPCGPSRSSVNAAMPRRRRLREPLPWNETSAIRSAIEPDVDRQAGRHRAGLKPPRGDPRPHRRKFARHCGWYDRRSRRELRSLRSISPASPCATVQRVDQPVDLLARVVGSKERSSVQRGSERLPGNGPATAQVCGRAGIATDLRHGRVGSLAHFSCGSTLSTV